MSGADWLHVRRGDASLVLAIPHAGTMIPEDIEARLVSPWRARQDADWWIDRLYGFAETLDATIVRTEISRTVIDVNRDPSGASLYPGQATTGLCPITTFDGEPLYRGAEPDAAEIARRRAMWFEPYHDAIAGEIARLRARHSRVVLYDAHSIRSHIPRLFGGELPHLNLGTNDGRTCAPELADALRSIGEASAFSFVANGRFKGGWTTRHYGRPQEGVHAVQMELATRGYLAEPTNVTPENWPAPFDPLQAAPLAAVLEAMLRASLAFARS